ncbi:MAG: hypothetical protein ACYSUX_07005 [Planctomycetota bacterium]|jgi:hypothetical protein
MVKEIISTIVIGLMIAIAVGCAPVTVSMSDPAIQIAANPYYEAQFEPMKQGFRSFVVFRLTVKNKTKTQLQIDWNKTRYLFNGSPQGIYVFRDIDPESIKSRTIAPDIISPQDVFTRIIAPQKLIAYTPFREQNEFASDESAFNGGPVPAGNNGILLVVRTNDKEIKERLTLDITDVKSK